VVVGEASAGRSKRVALYRTVGCLEIGIETLKNYLYIVRINPIMSEQGPDHFKIAERVYD
jgi:hypothetical protein